MLKDDSKLQILTPPDCEVRIRRVLKDDSKLQILTPAKKYVW